MKTEFNQDIYQKAIDIIADDERQKQYLKTCIKAEICPICGDKLIIEEYTDNNDDCSWDTYCTSDKSHFHKKRIIYDDDYDM